MQVLPEPKAVSNVIQLPPFQFKERFMTANCRDNLQEYGKGYEEKSLRRMMQFANLFPDPKIVAPLATQLSWSHFVEVIPG